MSFLRALVSFPDSPKNGRAPHGSPILVHATAEETGGTIGMWENFIPPGKGPTPHTHTRETEVFRVIEGTFRFWCGNDVIEGGAGTVVTLPPHVPHHWLNIGDTTGRMMGIATPGGAERLFLELAALENPTPADITRIEQSLGITSH
jgi:quercetin dioxygenase-like cupin family protein